MFSLILLALILTEQSVSGKFTAKQLAGIPSTNFNDGNSPIALWFQKSGLAVRICQREEKAHYYNSALSPMITAQINIGRCNAKLISSTQNVTAKQQVCPGIQTCNPNMTELINIRTENGIKEVANALDCTCTALQNCKRRTSLRLFYRGTKYERTIDIGTCSGSCKSKTCRPLSINTLAIKTPNGRKEVKVIEKCGCESPCYRMSYKKAYSVISSDSGDNNKTVTKIIDIGMCSGSASCPGKVRGKCIQWLTVSKKKVCVLHSSDRYKGCYADKKKPLVLNTTVTNEAVHIIDSCTCI